jgi:5,10-methylenetetrahydromethanopterin reductase
MFGDGQLNFKPRPDIPILIASGGRQILRVAGELADLVMLGDLGSAFVINQAMKEVEQGAARAGRSLRDIPAISRVNLILSQEVAEVRNLMKPWILMSLWHTYPNWEYFFFYTPEMEERLKPFKDFIEARGGGKPRNVGDYALVSPYRDLITDEMVRHSALAGNVDDVVEQIVEIAGTGINHITIYPMALPGQDVESVLMRFVDEVLPAAQTALS